MRSEGRVAKNLSLTMESYNR